MPHRQHFIPYLNRHVTLVDREQLRFRMHGRSFYAPTHLRALASQIPATPATWDGSKGRAVKYPCWKNHDEGDCYLEDALHCVCTWTGNVGTEATFDADAIDRLYRQLSGGDNGLGDSDVFPYWKSPGFFGHKILDEMTVDPSDDGAIRLGMWKFYGASYTASLLDSWLQDPRPGQVWDADGRPDPSAGHAMHLSGFGQYYQDETWGFDPAIRLTPAGLKASDPEVTLQFSLEMFNAQGIAPDGETYDQKATLWVNCGGANLPPSPFPTPTPVPPTPPPTPTPPPEPPPDPVVEAEEAFILMAMERTPPMWRKYEGFFLIAWIKRQRRLTDQQKATLIAYVHQCGG